MGRDYSNTGNRLNDAEYLLKLLHKQKVRPHKGRLLPNGIWKKIDAHLRRHGIFVEGEDS
jgi:hypothetical protein